MSEIDLAMLTDYYQLTMLGGYVGSQKLEQKAVSRTQSRPTFAPIRR